MKLHNKEIFKLIIWGTRYKAVDLQKLPTYSSKNDDMIAQ